MIRTQIQLPDDLHQQLRTIAERREWSFAEVIRRGMERYAATCHVDLEEREWSFPTLPPRKMKADPAKMRQEAEAIEGRLQ